MSKIGKNYTLYFNNSNTQTLRFLRLMEYANVDEFVEGYDSNLYQYTGSITLSLTDNKEINEFLHRSSEDLINVDSTNTRFSVDTHYEELLELKDLSTRTGMSGSNSLVSMADSLNLYKFKSSLEYNFLVRNYENFLTANPNKKETALPYFYEILSDFVTKDHYQQFSGTYFFENPSSVITSSQRNELIKNIIPYKMMVEKDFLRIDKYLEKFTIYKEEFPFYTDISFDTHELDEKSIISALEEKSLFASLMQLATNQGIEKSLNIVSGNIGQTLNTIEYDLKNFLVESLQSSVNTDFTFIFDLNQRIDDKARSFLEVLKNEEEYSEVIAYHLKKYDQTNTLLQEWYLPNVGDGKLKWVDSQIKYDKYYTYKLDLVVLTFATQYRINSVVRLADGRFKINFTNVPLIKTYILQNTSDNTNLGASYTNKLLDYPPMEPEIELVPYIGVDNQIKINLNTSTGLKTVPTVSFSDSEQSRINELKLAQNKDPNASLLTYQTDEPSDFMEIYRLDVHPKSYNDFKTKLLVNLSTNNSAGASFLDDITPNKKYYYVARAVDYHGNISNPTPIYELEMVNDNGLIIPFMRIVDFDKGETNKQQIKSFKKYIKIQPALKHRLTNIENTNQNDIELGQADGPSPWNQNFRLRLTSKSTGKKIDVKFKFKYNKPQ